MKNPLHFILFLLAASIAAASTNTPRWVINYYDDSGNLIAKQLPVTSYNQGQVLTVGSDNTPTIAPTILPSFGQTVYVSKSGNDATGNGSFTQPYLTISQAMASITDAASSKYYQILVSAGTYTENVVLKPAVFLCGNGGGGEAGAVRINGTLTLNSAFSTTAARAGLQNIAVLSNVTFDLASIGGGVSTTLDCFNFSCLGNFLWTGRGATDGIFWTTGYCIGTSTFTGGAPTCSLVQFVGNWIGQDSASVPTAQTYVSCYFVNGTQNIVDNGAGQTIVRLFGCPALIGSLTINGVGCTVYADIASLPATSGLTLTSSPTLVRFTDAFGMNFSPTTSGDWQTSPTQVHGALDALATRGKITTSTVATGSAVALTTATTANVTSVSLSAGTYDVTGVVDFKLSSATMTQQQFGISTTSATLGAQDTFGHTVESTTTLTLDAVGLPCPTVRLTLGSTTTVYLVAQATFSAGTVSAYGTLRVVQVK
jgi:hypothetical protein